MKHAILILLLVVLTTGCATTYPMKISFARAGTDIATTALIDNAVLTPDDAVLLVHQLRDALGRLDRVDQYTAEVYAATAPYVGGKLLARLLLKTLPKYAFQLKSYSFGLGQMLNQMEVAATQYPKKE